MTRTIATLLALSGLAACSSQAMAPATSIAEATVLPAPVEAFEADVPAVEDLAGAPIVHEPAPVPAPTLAPRPVAPQPVAPQPKPRIEPVRSGACDIVVKRTGNGVLLKAVANLSRPMSGDYSFVITKSGGGGSSDIDQGGPFEAGAGRTELGASEISMGRGASYRATLKLISNGREICRRQVRS